MLNTDFVNYRLQTLLRNEINKRPEYYYKLRNIACCGTRCIDKHGGLGVTVLANSERVKIDGVKRCQQSWCCPVCSAKEMAKYSARIDCAIQALKEQGLVPIMITFTIFHTISDSIETTFGILRRAYELVSKSANWKRKKKDGTYYESNGAWNNFIKEFGIRHIVKAAEVTYGRHGWHPHLHNLLFVPKARLKDIAAWEPQLQEFWRRKEESAIKEFIEDARNAKVREFLYAKHDARESGTVGLYISKDDKGNARVMDAAAYISGWGGAAELTGVVSKKARAEGHYQILELAEEGVNGNEKLLNKFLEFAAYVTANRVHRIDFSRTGINQIIRKYQQTQAYKEFIKKKRTAEKPYHTVCWFTSNQWNELNCVKYPAIPLIIAFANAPNAYELICELCKVYGIMEPARCSILYDPAAFWNGKAKTPKQSMAELVEELLA